MVFRRHFFRHAARNLRFIFGQLSDLVSLTGFGHGVLRPTVAQLESDQGVTILPCHRDFSLLLGDFSSFSRHFQSVLDLLFRFPRAYRQLRLFHGAELVVLVLAFLTRAVFERRDAVPVSPVV